MANQVRYGDVRFDKGYAEFVMPINYLYNLNVLDNKEADVSTLQR